MTADSAVQPGARQVADRALARGYGAAWLAALAVSGALIGLLVWTLGAAWIRGVGVWGVNIPFVWGFDLINYAWWIGVANGASLFAAILVLRRHDLRTAVNRFAEATALMAVVCAGLFPIIHLGRPWLFYWVFPYPATTELWPQFRSTLTWDFWAISTHALVTSLLWYVGLIPDLATLRDRAPTRRRAQVYGLLALGWRFSLRHWAYHQVAYRIVAVLVLPLILVMQSTVAFEFASTLVPGWHDTRLPLHFVTSGLAQGLATVLFVAALLRRTLRLERIIDDADMNLLGRLVLAASLAAGYLFLDEVLSTWLSDPVRQRAGLERFTGTYAPFAILAFLLAVLVPQILWWRAARLGFWGPVLVGLSVNAAVWCDRFSLLIGGLQRGHLPSLGGTYAPTLTEAGLLLGTLGLFAALMLLFARFVPVVALYEVRHDEHQERT